MAGTAAGRQLHDEGGPDFTTRAGRAQARGLDDRIAEVVVLFVGDLASTEPDPDLDPVGVIPVVAIGALLHRDRARQRVRRGMEDHHQTVAEVLDLCPTGLRDGLAHRGEDPAPDVVGGFGRDGLGELCGPDDVGEQHRDVLRGHKAAPSVMSDDRVT